MTVFTWHAVFLSLLTVVYSETFLFDFIFDVMEQNGKVATLENAIQVWQSGAMPC